MPNWKLLTDESELAAWDRRLLGFEDYSIYQSLAWGEYRRTAGWIPHRWIAYGDGEVVAMAQVLSRRYPGSSAVLWIPGGPVGDVAAAGDSLFESICASVGASWVYCRFNSLRGREKQDDMMVAGLGWRRPRTRLSSGQSLIYDTSSPEPARLAACGRNWRHNLRRSQKRDLVFERWESPDPAALRSLYASMEEHKALAMQYSEAALRALLASLGEHLLVYRCRSSDGELQSVRACAWLGTRAWDMLAATSVAGRKSYASYGVFWALLEDCHRRGIGAYDLSGVDPEGNKGVYDFKRGTGAALIEYSGEWERARPKWLAWPADWLMRSRQGTL